MAAAPVPGGFTSFSLSPGGSHTTSLPVTLSQLDIKMLMAAFFPGEKRSQNHHFLGAGWIPKPLALRWLFLWVLQAAHNPLKTKGQRYKEDRYQITRYFQGKCLSMPIGFKEAFKETDCGTKTQKCIWVHQLSLHSQVAKAAIQLSARPVASTQLLQG